MSGYDPVSYFDGKPKRGKSDLQFHFEGLKYNFISSSNLEKFKRSPNSFVPQYGGWCAYAMGNDGTKVKIDPETYKIINGKLYLFYNFYFTNTLDDWNEDEPTLMKKADEYWIKILNK